MFKTIHQQFSKKIMNNLYFEQQTFISQRNVNLKKKYLQEIHETMKVFDFWDESF